MTKIRGIAVIFIILVYLSQAAFAAYEEEKKIFGRIENIQILPDKHQLTAKLDTGADGSSLSATNIKFYKKGDEKHIVFTVIDSSDHAFTLDQIIKKHVRIKNREQLIELTDEENTRRPVVDLTICIGRQIQTIPVNLIDRGNFKYPFLLGWKALVAFNGVVDPSTKFLSKLNCKDEK